ncbi:MAG TPA: AAA domain-containing protein [Acidimicrobiales bacterium]|nr:AAA domain-containing protein [Acidimicrobiales bacterium]
MTAPTENSRRRSVDAAVTAWMSQLVDLGASNRLLYYRTLRVGTLDLDNAAQPAIESLRQGARVRLGDLFRDDELRADAARRMRAINAKAVENLEERGLRTLYLAWGMATWTPLGTAATPAAPVLLFPLRAARKGTAGEDFELTVTGEAQLNPTLIQLLQSRHGLTVAADDIVDQATPDHAIEPDAMLIFNEMTHICAPLAGFAITARNVIGNFSFAKLPMVNDLNASRAEGADHDLIASIAGDAGARKALAARAAAVVPDDLPDSIAPADEHLVLPADASQSHVINRVLNGESITIQGPPGTGKSQTIANMIASLVAQGKRVLFVAEKRAAIDAVVKRLHQVGLDDIVLDLHSVSTTKAAFARAIAQSLQSPEPVDTSDRSAPRQLIEARQALHDYAQTMHVIREPFGLSLYDLQAEMFAFPAVVHNPHVLPRSTTDRFGREDYHTIAAGVREYAALAMSGSEQSPWARATLSSNDEASVALDHAHALRDDECASVDQALRSLAATLGITAPTSFSGWQPVLALISEVQRVLAAFNPTIFDEADLESLCATLAKAEKQGGMASLSRSLSGGYRGARRRARALQREGITLDDVQLYRGLATARDARTQWLARAKPGHPPRPVAGYEQLTAAYQTLLVRLSALDSVLPDQHLASLGTAEIRAIAAALAEDAVGVYRQPRLRALERQIEQYQLAPVLEHAKQQKLDAEQLVDTIRFTWLRSVYSMLAPELASFDGALHDRRRDDYCRLDAQHMAGAAARVRKSVQHNISLLRQSFPEQVQLVEAQAARTRGHLPSRELIACAPDVVTRARPCWTMSPLLVAQLLPPRCFDVVVFDEASQILPADAVPTLLRAHQVVIAGDSEQLPPTTFFATDTDADISPNESASDEPPNASALTSGLESILDVATALLAPGFLRWHYRSLDERLVGFSNSRFYENTLTTFPNPMVLGAPTTQPPCLTHIVVDSDHDAAGSATDEVGRVVQLVLEHARTRPDETLGVIAMGIVHAERITEALRRARAAAPDDDDELESFFDDDAEERFFIKNLERVQGDERDAIVLSIGYEKSANGQLSHNFGPLNQGGGERRVNVAITRARRRMTLVSSFESTAIDLNRTNARGVALLRDYMVYAGSGGGAAARGASGIALDPFLEHVRGWLAALSLPVTPMVGQSSYRVDFALAHPTDGARGIAVECDAQTYSEARTTRDRDRLRPEALQRLGWDVHRVWSAQWYRDPQSEAERIRDAWRTMTGQ